MSGDDEAPRYTEWDKKLMEYVISRGADINQMIQRDPNDTPLVPLFEALNVCNHPLAKDLITMGARIDFSFPNGRFKHQTNALTYLTRCTRYQKRTLDLTTYLIKELKIFPINSVQFCSGMMDASTYAPLWHLYVSLGGDPDKCSKAVGLD
jgi:hypothetical protein